MPPACPSGTVSPSPLLAAEKPSKGTGQRGQELLRGGARAIRVPLEGGQEVCVPVSFQPLCGFLVNPSDAWGQLFFCSGHS